MWTSTGSLTFTFGSSGCLGFWCFHVRRPWQDQSYSRILLLCKIVLQNLFSGWNLLQIGWVSEESCMNTGRLVWWTTSLFPGLRTLQDCCGLRLGWGRNWAWGGCNFRFSLSSFLTFGGGWMRIVLFNRRSDRSEMKDNAEKVRLGNDTGEMEMGEDTKNKCLQYLTHVRGTDPA